MKKAQLLPSAGLLIALMGCSSDALDPTEDPPNFAVTRGLSNAQCFALAQELDKTNLIAAENTAEEIRLFGDATIYVGAAWGQRTGGGAPTRFVKDNEIFWRPGVTHRRIQYATDGRVQAEIRPFGLAGHAVCIAR